MSRIKLLLDVIENIHALGDSLQILADAVASGEPPEEPEQKSKTKAGLKPEQSMEEISVKSEKKPVTLEEVRAVLAEKSRAGFTGEVKAVITKHGAEKLSDVDPTEFEELLAEAEVIGNA